MTVSTTLKQLQVQIEEEEIQHLQAQSVEQVQSLHSFTPETTGYLSRNQSTYFNKRELRTRTDHQSNPTGKPSTTTRPAYRGYSTTICLPTSSKSTHLISIHPRMPLLQQITRNSSKNQRYTRTNSLSARATQSISASLLFNNKSRLI